MLAVERMNIGSTTIVIARQRFPGIPIRAIIIVTTSGPAYAYPAHTARACITAGSAPSADFTSRSTKSGYTGKPGAASGRSGRNLASDGATLSSTSNTAPTSSPRYRQPSTTRPAGTGPTVPSGGSR